MAEPWRADPPEVSSFQAFSRRAEEAPPLTAQQPHGGGVSSFEASFVDQEKASDSKPVKESAFWTRIDV